MRTGWLRYRVGAAEALDHRGAQKVGAELVAVGDGSTQLVVEFLALDRVLLLDIALVLDSLALQVFLRNGAALAVVLIEHIFIRGALNDRSELVGQIERVVEAEIHAHAAERIVDVGGVAGKEKPAVPIARSDALVHAIDIAVDD